MKNRAYAPIALASTCLLVAPALTLLQGTGVAGAATSTVLADADAYVTSASPSANYGSSTSLWVDGSPIMRSYLRFPALSGTPSKAVLQVYATRSTQAFEVRGVSDTGWTEAGLTYKNAPALGVASVKSGAVVRKSWVSIDVTSLLPGSGDISLALAIPLSKTSQAVSSRESGTTYAPRLLVDQPPTTNQRPTVVADGTPRSGPAPLAVSFSAIGSDPDGSVVSYSWNFGDGTSSAVQNPSHSYAAGTYTATVTATDNGGATASTSIAITATKGTTPPPSTDPVLASVGDIATSGNGRVDVANAIKAATPDAVLMTGDYNQSTGTLSAILSTPDPFYGPKPGGLYPIMYPTAGPTHDIASCSDPLGYQQYWGRSPYDPYSFNLGAWHIISMPQPITRYGCSNRTAVQTWLQNDLATHPNICTLAYWHEPYFSPTTSGHPATTATKSWVDTLIAAHAELLVAGHQNGDFVAYTTPQTSGNANGTDANGIRAFVAATGSQTGYTISSGGNHNYSSSASGIWGFLKMTLHPAAWDWQFVRVGGATVSGPTSGSGTCH